MKKRQWKTNDIYIPFRKIRTFHDLINS